MKNLGRIPLLLLLAATASGARGADLKFGVQMTASFPAEDLKSLVVSKKGVGGGLFLDVLLGEGHSTLRPRLDFVRYPKNSWYAKDGSLEDARTWSTASLGMDYLYHVGEDRKGLYLAAGMALHQVWQEIHDAGTFKTSRLGLSLGAGYTFGEHWEANLRYTRAKVERFDLGALNAGAAFRF